MWEKKNTTWDRIDTHYDTSVFKSILERLKTYSKCVNASAYNVTNTLDDVYSNLKYQNAIWVQLTDFADDTLEFMGLTLEKGKFYNMLKYFSCKTLSDSAEFRELLENGTLKASNAKLFEDILDPARKDWFCQYQPQRINEYINQPFDFLVIRYKLKDPNSRDLDTRTALVDTSFSDNYLEDGVLQEPALSDPLIDGNDIGFNRGETIASTQGLTYLDWGGDNVTSVGGESILVDFKQIAEDINFLDTISVRLRAYFFLILGNGQIEIEISTYAGGTMIKDIPNADFTNDGGVLVQQFSVDRKITTQFNGDIDGDDLGTVVFNVANNNAIVTDVDHNTIKNNDVTFAQLLDLINFDEYEWQMGTSGYLVDDPNYTDMLVDHTFECDEIETVYQSSYDEFGYTQKNVFTSEKVFDKLLKNFQVIDIATTEHIDINNLSGLPIQYPIIDIDGVRAVPNHRILFKNQDDSKDNGVYLYNGSTFTRDEIFETDEDLVYFSAFIKEGTENKNKEFFLERRENGEYPTFEDYDCECKCDCLDETICEKFQFVEGENFVLRNRSSYKLLADHTFTDANYFTRQEPITNTDFSNRLYTDSTSGEYYLVGDEFNTLELYSADNELLNEGRAGLATTDTLNTRIETLPVDELFLLRNENEIVRFITFTDGNIDMFESITTLPFNSVDYQLTNSTSGFFLSNDTLHRTDFSTSGNVIYSDIEIDLAQNSTEIRVLDNYYFYLTVNGLHLNLNDTNYRIANLDQPTNLRVDNSGTNFNVSYLIDNSPNTLTIEESELLSLLSWQKEEDYDIRDFSKTKIEDWEIIGDEGTSNLFLKGVQITNTDDLASIPKIHGTNSRLYDGVDDYSNLNNNETINQSIVDLTNSGGSFTMEFKVKPNNIRVNQPVFYFGNQSQTVTYKSGLNVFELDLPPREYITFYVDSGDDFPVFIISNGVKKIEVKSNKKLTIGTETHVSFSWNYTTNKAYGVLYFDGTDVGQATDQQLGNNIPIDIRALSYDRNYFGRSEFQTNPLYEGFLSEFRLWDRSFNSAQIITRIDKNITPFNENFYSNLKGYWKLDDEISLQKNLIYDLDPLITTGIGSALFLGGLNNDEILSEIETPQMIQLGDEDLYVFDKKFREERYSPLNGSDGTAFWGLSDYVGNVVDINGTNAFRLFPNKIGISHTIFDIGIGDEVTLEADTYFDDTGNGTGGAIFVELQDSGTSSIVTQLDISTNSSSWTKLSGTYEITQPFLQFDVGVTNQIGGEKAYFLDFFVTINRKENPFNDIYKINLTEESVTHIYRASDQDQIESIYLENETQRFFFLEENNVYEIDSNDNSSLVHTQIDSSQIIDFAYIDNVPYMLNSTGILYDDSMVIYSGINNTETIYGYESTGINKTILYWKENDESINVLSRDISNTTALDYKAKFPFIVNNSVSVTTIEGTSSVINNYDIVDNRVLFNGEDLDPLNIDWGFNLKDVWGIYKRGERVLIGVRTILDQIQLWMHDPSDDSRIKFVDNRNISTLFLNNSNTDLSTFTLNNEEWIVITNVDSVRFYLIENDNKVNFKKVHYTVNINTDKYITEIQFNTKDELWLTLDKGNTKFISLLTADNTNYNLFENIIDYTEIEDGWLIGESGILFEDNTKDSTSGESFVLDFNNIIYKDDFNDLETAKTRINRDLGYSVLEWRGIAWAVGDLGRMIRTYDDGTNWEVLDTGVFHNLTSVSFINETDGLIVGLNGTILATFSGGDSFVTVDIPESIGLRDWHEVLYYDVDKAIIVGNSGTILHLRRTAFVWSVDRILNNIELAELEVQIKQSDLEDSIKLNIQKETDSDVYRQTIRNIEYLGDKQFLIVGDNDLICHLRIVEQIDYIEPYLNFFQTGLNIDWNDVVQYNDLANNQRRAFILGNKDIYSIEWDRFNLADDVNIERIQASLYTSSDEVIRTIEISNNNFIYAGERVEVCKNELFLQGTDGIFGYSTSGECLDLSENFLPRMLFLDYYMGRKINIHLDNGDFVKPVGLLDKSKLDCFYFTEGEYIEFTDYGTVDNQNNYLAYQDHYYLNRRLLDVPNSWGKTQQPYNKYNKRITAIEDYDRYAVWEGQSSTSGGYEFVNEAVTDLNLFQNGDLREDSFTTKLNLGLINEGQYSTSGIFANRLAKTSEDPLDNGLFNTTIEVDDNSLFSVNEYVKLDYSDYPFRIIEIITLFSGDFIVVEGIQTSDILVTGTVEKLFISTLSNLAIGDVINLAVIDEDRSRVMEVGDRLYYQLKTEVLDLHESVVVEEKNDNENFIQFRDFEVNFAKGSTINDLFLNFFVSTNSPSLQVANQLLSRRCVETKEEEFRIFDEDVTNYATNNDVFDYVYVAEFNKLYLATNSPNRIQVINTLTNRLETTINVKSGAQNIAYSPRYKKIYVSGGAFSNHKLDVIDVLTDTLQTSIDLGITGRKLLYSPLSKFVYVTTNSNQYFVINNTTINSVIPEVVTNHVYIDSTQEIYAVDNTNIINRINNTSVVGSITIVGAPSLDTITYDPSVSEDFVYVSSFSTNRVYVINKDTNAVVNSILIPEGLGTENGFELISYNNVNRLYISNYDGVSNTKITILDADTNSIIKTVDTDIKVKSFKYNEFENYIYIGGEDGEIKLINVDTEEIESIFESYTLPSGNVNEMVYIKEDFGRIYPLTFAGEDLVSLISGKFIPSNIEVELNSLITENTTVVRDIEMSKNQLTIWDLWRDEMVYEVNKPTSRLLFRNLNYFNGDQLNLQEVFETHLIGDSYDITVNQADNIIIEGSVNDLTKYYNLESFVTYATYSGTDSSTLVLDVVPVEYDSDVVYGPNYSLMSFLNNLDPMFNYDYEFSTDLMPSETFNYQPLTRTANNEFIEFRIEKNIIYIGTDYADQIEKFRPGVFLDITNGNKEVTRVYIREIRTETYDKYPENTRYVLVTDKQLEDNLNLVGPVTLRSRNKLGEVSMDLEFTDDIMFPISNNGSNAVELFNRRYYNNQVTSYQYSRIITNDDNIRDNVSCFVHLDEEADWILNVVNWKDDPNFFYRPLDLHEVGVDRVLKKGISIDSSNYLLDGDRLTLANVDFDKTNFRIVDGLTLQDIEEKYYWVLNADIRNAIIGEDTSGFVWYQGDWLCGTWEGGTWYSGQAFEMEWVQGDVYSNEVVNNFNLISTFDDGDPTNTIWYNAIWLKGNWFNGTWNNGDWRRGTKFRGIWNNGIWRGGIWESGEFSGGEWLGGTWLSGTFSQGNTFSVWHNGTWLGGDFENGTWLNGIFDQTDRVASRFGTKASLLNPAIWEYGLWKNGSFHSGLVVDEEGNTIASDNYANSIWRNGVWEKGTFYGGQWELGVWVNGVWEFGYWKSNININEFRVRFGNELIVGSDVEVEFDRPHLYKDLVINSETNELQQNYFVILGKPDIMEGQIHPNTDALGHNTNAKRHIIKEILDDRTVLINIEDDNFPYNSTGGILFTDITTSVDVFTESTCGLSGTSACCIYDCTDYAQTIVVVEDSETIPSEVFNYEGVPMVASHWRDGKFNTGIWEYGYFNNGTWVNAIFIDGVWENGLYGGD